MCLLDRILLCYVLRIPKGQIALASCLVACKNYIKPRNENAWLLVYTSIEYHWQQSAIKNMPDFLYCTAIFLGGEWGVVDFTGLDSPWFTNSYVSLVL